MEVAGRVGQARQRDVIHRHDGRAWVGRRDDVGVVAPRAGSLRGDPFLALRHTASPMCPEMPKSRESPVRVSR